MGRGKRILVENLTRLTIYRGVVMQPGRRAGPGVGKYKYNAKSPKQGSQRFNSIAKTIHLAHLGILFIYG